MLHQLLAQALPSPEVLESQGVNAWIIVTVLGAGMAFVGATGRHFLNREQKLYEATIARESDLNAKNAKMQELQQGALLELAKTAAAQTERLILVVQQATAAQQQMITTITALSATIHDLARELGIERDRRP